MVNLFAFQQTLVRGLMKMAGISSKTVEIEPGTTMTFWIPSETIPKPKKSKTTGTKDLESNSTETIKPNPNKPVVILVHGFAAAGLATWQFQIGALTKKYSVYVPDLLFFGGSTTDKPDRSPAFQAECLAKSIRKLGVEKCTVVGFSYGGMVAFKMAELYPDLVQALVITGSVLTMTDSTSTELLSSLGYNSLSELLLPDSVKGLKLLMKVVFYKKLWIPDRLLKDYIEVTFNHRKEKAELLEGLIVKNKDITIPNFPQRICLLWGEHDQNFTFHLAQSMKEQLGDKASLHGIKKAGHLVHLERPCAYNRGLKHCLASLSTEI